ncbi:MAG: ABC transporter ATP-binding protein [Deltaproteobacteria bacterium]|nr:ABC transporter ATP-binding protein [Deltaproteobacteria bacterium]
MADLRTTPNVEDRADYKLPSTGPGLSDQFCGARRGAHPSLRQIHKIDAVHDHHIALVEAPRDQRRVALRVEALCKRYGGIEAVAGVSFDVNRGEVFGLLGLNGAGKTTLISMLATQRCPSAGDALLLGHSIRDEPRAVRQMIGVAPQEIALYPMLTAAENLGFFGRIYGVRGAELAQRVEQLLHFIGLQDRGHERVATYSGGMKRRLNMAAALVHRPKLILLDEPTAGVDPQSREEVLNLVRRLRDDGNAILYSTHHLDEAEKLCDRICILHEGKIRATGTLDGLLRTLKFSEIIELKGLSARTDLSPIRAFSGACRVEHGDGQMRLFVKRAADFLEPLQKIISRDKSARLRISPISLENLFLYFTGREVRE